MELAEPSKLQCIDESWHDEYKIRIHLLWNQIIQLNSNVFILKKLRKFPFDLFRQSSGDTTFWSLVFRNFSENCIMIINKIALDRDKDALTLQKLRKLIIDKSTDNSFRQQFKNDSRGLGIFKNKKKLEEKFKLLRNKLLAHFDEKFNSNKNSLIKIDPLHLNELDEICIQIKPFFSLLCIDKGRSELYASYFIREEKPYDSDSITDIERLLDLIAKNSTLLNMPEEQKGYWPHHRKTLSEDQLKTLNFWRERFNKLPV